MLVDTKNSINEIVQMNDLQNNRIMLKLFFSDFFLFSLKWQNPFYSRMYREHGFGLKKYILKTSEFEKYTYSIIGAGPQSALRDSCKRNVQFE